MPHKTYQHIERLDSDEVIGLLEGRVYIFPKIDGTNASLWLEDDGNVHAGSRKRDLVGAKDNFDFHAGYLMGENYERFLNFFAQKPGWRLFGEYLVPHTLRTYRLDAWRKFYVFDVWEEGCSINAESGETTGRYLPYDEYQPVLEEHNLDYIPALAIIEYPTEEQLLNIMMKHNTYLIRDGAGVGEGIVLKRYEFVNEWGRTV